MITFHGKAIIAAQTDEPDGISVCIIQLCCLLETSYLTFASTCRYRKVDNRQHYYEQLRIMKQRHEYLHKMRRNCHENRPVVFLDETWANAHDEKDCAWVERDKITGGTLGNLRYLCYSAQKLIL